MVQDAIGVNGHDPIGELAQVPDVLVSHIVGGFPLFSVSRLVNAQHECSAPKRLA